MMDRLRLINFNAQKCAPNFFKFLEERGKVEVGEEFHIIARFGLSNEEDPHRGLAKPVKLNGEQIGKLEVYVDPPVVGYVGKLPNVPKPKGGSRRTRQTPQVDEHMVAWSDVSIHYHDRHKKANKKKGRSDGWTTIPLP